MTALLLSALGPTAIGPAYGDISKDDSPFAVAAIFAGNELDDAALGENEFDEAVPNNCYLHERPEAGTPSTGRIAKIGKSGSKAYLGTGETLIRDDIVISAAHVVSAKGADEPAEDEEFVFEVYEPGDEGCRISTYRIAEYKVLTARPNDPRCAHLDLAVFRLESGVSRYRPLEFAPEELVEEFRNGSVAATKVGFANHPSTGFGRDWSIVTGRAFPVLRHDPSCRNDGLFAHDADAWSGESGAVFRIQGRMVGVHIRGYDREYEAFSAGNANIGVLATSEVRRQLLEIIRELGGH